VHHQFEAEIVENRAFQHQRPHHPEEMAEREGLSDILSPSWRDDAALAYTSRGSGWLTFLPGLDDLSDQGLWASH
jgi:hypothetical protein